MAALTEPNLSLSYGWAYRESGWKPGMDANLQKLGTIVQCAVKNNTTTAPPGAPTDGDRYIIASVATGDWAGLEGQIAVWFDDESDWLYYAPAEGWLCWVEALDKLYVYKDAAWTASGASFLPAGTYADPIPIGTGVLWQNVTDGGLWWKWDGVANAPASDTDGVAVAFGSV